MSCQFFIVGAQRSATTWLYKMLDQHPQVEMAKPMRPEPKFFLRDELFARGIGYYEQTYYAGKEGMVRGEKSTSYIESRVAAERIARCFPDARIIFFLRDPIRRAISNYRFSHQLGFETASMEEAFCNEEQRREDYDKSKVSASPYAYLSRGEYIRYLRMYEEYFSADQLHVFVSENVVGCAEGLRTVYGALGVNRVFNPAGIESAVNQSSGDEPVTMSKHLREMLQARFAESNAALAARYGLDLSRWSAS
ncbi:MAG: sulfotransferase [Rhodothermales bacterium]